jgi:SNF2 family DNA or RNA helicase
LSNRPVYLNRGKTGYVAVDLSPLAPLLHLFLTHHAELGALHPSDADVARLAEEALMGSSIRFADNAGILPLARSLRALAEADSFAPPTGLTAQLRDYQAYGAAWMGSLVEAGFGGVLADDMGLGKTVQTLALLQARREAGAPGPALLIVPTSLLHGWESQAVQFTPGLRLVTLHGTGRAARREAALEADLVVTTYPLLARDRDWLAAQDWPLVILDEAQTLKNPASQMAKTLREIPAKGRLALTGTPLENSLQDIWTLIDWINPGLLGDRKKFQTLFRTPIEKHGDATAQARLNRRLRPFLLRRTKEEVAAELPPKTEILERVELAKPQQALYETVRSAMDARVREAIAKRGAAAARITVLDALLKLRQVCCDPALVKTAAARSVTESAKRTRLRDLLGELVAEGRRVLVFSQFVEMLRLIEADLTEAGISHLTLTGQTQNRAEVLDSFAQGDAAVFLLSLKAGGVGLTLTEADTVILYDPWWNPAVERQAMDRTHRIGQSRPVFVHRLVAAGTVEEKILAMQVRKQALADALFDDIGTVSESLLDEATLQDLFAPLSS